MKLLFIIININTLQSPAAAPATSQVNTNNHSSQPAAAAVAAPAPRVVSTAFKCKYLIQSSVIAQAELLIVSVIIKPVISLLFVIVFLIG